MRFLRMRLNKCMTENEMNRIAKWFEMKNKRRKTASTGRRRYRLSEFHFGRCSVRMRKRIAHQTILNGYSITIMLTVLNHQHFLAYLVRSFFRTFLPFISCLVSFRRSPSSSSSSFFIFIRFCYFVEK